MKRLSRPGQLRIPVPLLIVFSPVLVPILGVRGLAVMARDIRRKGRAKPGRTGNNLAPWVILATLVTIPATAVGAWYVIRALHLFPLDPAGLWITLVLAAAYGVQAMIVASVIGCSLAWHSGDEGAKPVANPVRYFVRAALMFLFFYCAVNAPLTLCLAVFSARH
jgi:hypothetical protein